MSEKEEVLVPVLEVYVTAGGARRRVYRGTSSKHAEMKLEMRKTEKPELVTLDEFRKSWP